MNNLLRDTGTIRTLLHLINEIGTGSMKTIEGNREVLLGSSKMLDVGSEVSIPAMTYEKSEENYQFTRGYRYNNMETLCQILIRYLELKENEEFNSPDTHRDYHVLFKRPGANLLQFHDFYLCEQGYLIAEQYLDNSGEYGYEDDGLAELASIIAIHMFRHLTIRSGYLFNEYDLSQSPGGMFAFKPGLNLEDLIGDHIDDIDGVWRYEDEEDDWEDDEDDWE